MGMKEIGDGLKIGILEDKSAKELGKPGTDRWVLAVCPSCKKARWLKRWEVQHKNKTGLCRSCYNIHMKQMLRDKNPAWKGGRRIFNSKSNQYIQIKHDEAKAKGGYIFEHILIWQTVHNRKLPEGWEVHHLNGIGIDNRPENLVALPSSKHKKVLASKAKRIRELEAKIKLLEKALDANQMIYQLGGN